VNFKVSSTCELLNVQDDMGRACRAHGEMRYAYKILVGQPGARDHSDAWNHVAQGRDQWWALVNMVRNLRFPSKAVNFLTS
jgi:hypothetical protein